MTEYFIAWWNVENLFDKEDAPNRERKVANAVKSDLKGWTEQHVKDKMAALASVIKKMNSDAGPDLIGLCEVENEELLNNLVKEIGIQAREYKVDLIPGPDKRGIDVAFIYDKKKFEPHIVDGEYKFSHEVVKRSPTRDILQVNLVTKETPNKPIIFIANHWYARSAGIYQSEPYRIIAAETLSYWLERIKEIHGDGGWPPVLVMGDFNGLLWERALKEYAKSTVVQEKVENAKTVPWLFNLMWPLTGTQASYYYDDEPYILDQFLVSKGFMPGESTFSFKVNSVQIYSEPRMMKDGQPRRMGLPAKNNYDKDGFSDHLPITMVIEQT
ncbi:MAG: endonuclease/exonuclease/phosphatase family protein [Promethearchaeota archaeon]